MAGAYRATLVDLVYSFTASYIFDFRKDNVDQMYFYIRVTLLFLCKILALMKKQGSKFDQMGRAYKQVSIQYNCTKFYSFILLISCDNTDYRGRPLAQLKNIWSQVMFRFKFLDYDIFRALSKDLSEKGENNPSNPLKTILFFYCGPKNCGKL